MTSAFGSDNNTKGSLYLSANLLCESMVSLLTPRTMTFFFLNDGFKSRNPQASLVQPGVLSLG
jgi:hypothetical protein